MTHEPFNEHRHLPPDIIEERSEDIFYRTPPTQAERNMSFAVLVAFVFAVSFIVAAIIVHAMKT